MIVNKNSSYKKNRYIEDENYASDLDRDVGNLFLALQNRVRFGDPTDGKSGENIAGQFQVVADTGSVDTQFTVAHTIGAVPTGYLILKTNKGGVVYDSGTTWTSSNVYLKCSAANAAITIFLVK